MGLTNKIIESLPDGIVQSVIIGLNWTAVQVKCENQIYCGLSSTLRRQHAHGKEYDVPLAGELTGTSARELAMYCYTEKPTLASIGTAAANALLQTKPLEYVEKNAEMIIAEHGEGKHVVIVGHFPFTERIRKIAGKLDVLENKPQSGDLHANQAQNTIPSAQVVAITGMAFVNRTLETLLSLCKPNATVIILGASTPLSSILFEYGADYLCGAVTVNAKMVIKTVAEGGIFPQIARAGLKLITIQRST